MKHLKNDIKTQALIYADTVEAIGTTTLFFYPLKKSSAAWSNRFRYEVCLNLGAQFEGFGSTRKSRLEQMQQYLEDEGYTFVEVDLEDYDPSLYREQIAQAIEP